MPLAKTGEVQLPLGDVDDELLDDGSALLEELLDELTPFTEDWLDAVSLHGPMSDQ